MATYKPIYKNGCYVAPDHITDDMVKQAMEAHELKKNGGIARLNNCTIIAPLRRQKCSARQSLREFYEGYHYPLTTYDTKCFDEPKVLREIYTLQAKKRRKILFKVCVFAPIYLLCAFCELIKNALYVFTEKRGFVERVKQTARIFALVFLGILLSYITEIFAGRDSFNVGTLFTLTSFSGFVAIALCVSFTEIIKHWGHDFLLPGPLYKLDRDLFEFYYKDPKYGSFPLSGAREAGYEASSSNESSITYFGEDAIYFAGKPKYFQYKNEK